MKKMSTLLFLIGGLGLGIIAAKLGIKYAFALSILMIGPIAMMLKPTRGLYLLASYAVLDFVFRTQGGMLSGLWDELLFVGIVGLFLIHMLIQSKGFAIQLTNLDVPIFIFFGISIFLLLINSPELHIAVEGIRVILQYILWYFVAINIIKEPVAVKKILLILIVIGLILSLHGIYQYIIGVEIPTTWYDSKHETSMRTRVFSIIGSPNILGSLLVLILPITLSFVLNERGWLRKLLYLGAMGAMVLCLVFTFSRGAWLAFALSAVIYTLLKDKRLAIPMVLGGILLLVLVPQIGDRIAYMLSPEYMLSSARGGRIARWTAALEAVKTSPLFGVGLGRYGGAVAMRNIPGSFYTDNFYLKTMAEMGIVGVTAFLYLLYRGAIESLRAIRKLKDDRLHNIGLGIFTGLIGLLAQNAVENVFEVPMMATYFWILVAVILSLPSMEDKGHCEVK
ncbi:MAG: O-antigen ligase family protein [Thermotaleaceae bacterium]